MNYEIVSIKQKHIIGFWNVLGSLARERKYITLLEGPSMGGFRAFALGIEK